MTGKFSTDAQDVLRNMRVNVSSPTSPIIFDSIFLPLIGSKFTSIVRSDRLDFGVELSFYQGYIVGHGCESFRLCLQESEVNLPGVIIITGEKVPAAVE